MAAVIYHSAGEWAGVVYSLVELQSFFLADGETDALLINS
ncbi:hypothetical protein GWI33_011700, partial [Rhynchophorus ferrugineus]